MCVFGSYAKDMVCVCTTQVVRLMVYLAEREREKENNAYERTFKAYLCSNRGIKLASFPTYVGMW